MNLNKVYLVGTLTREPESRETHGGSTVVRITVSVSRDYFSKERNQRVRETDSFEVQAWGPLGVQLAAQAHRGSSIFIEGRLKQDSWETPTGERRQRTIVHLETYALTVAGRAPHMPRAAHAAGAHAANPPAGGAPAAAHAPEGAEGAELVEGEEGDEGAGESSGAPGAPGASGRRKRRRRRGPRRDGIPAAAPATIAPEERAAFAAGVIDGTPATPAPSGAASGSHSSSTSGSHSSGTSGSHSSSTSGAHSSGAPSHAAPPPPPPAPLPPPTPSAAPAPAPRAVPNTSLKDDMPF